MTDTECWVNQTCERIMHSGEVRLYRDLYKDLRERLPCDVACRLIADGMAATRLCPGLSVVRELRLLGAERGRAIAALRRLWRYDRLVRLSLACETVDWSNAGQ